MRQDRNDAQMLTERLQRSQAIYGDGNDERGGGIHRDALLNLGSDLPDEDVRRAMRTIAENALDPEDGRQLLAALGFLDTERTMQCSRCRALKPVEQFRVDHKRSRGRRYDCRRCENAARRDNQ